MQQQPHQQGQYRGQPQVVLPKILRIGVVLGGKIVEEKLIRKRETVTIGQSAKNTFAVPAPELPKTFPIFQMTPQGYVMNFVDGMDGRISDGDNVYPLLQMTQTGVARRNGAYWSLPLVERAKGKITVGDLTLLFQFVAPPPPAAKPQLPHSVRGSVMDRLDPYLAVALLFSAALHIGFIIWTWQTEKSKKPDISLVSAEDAQRWASFKPPPEPEPEPVAVEPTEGPGTTVAEQPTKGNGGQDPKGPAKQPKGGDKGDGGDNEPGAREARVNQEIASNKFLQTLGYRTNSGSGSIYDYSEGRDPGTDTDKALAQGGKIVGPGTPGGPLGGTRGTNETGKVAAGGPVKIGGPAGTVDTGGPKEEKRVTSVSGGKADVDDEDAVPAASIAAKIRSSYMGGVKACYERGLKQNPDMGGRVEIEFTIGPLGTVQKASIASSDLDNPTVESCIKTAAKAWSFNKPKSGEPVTVQYPFIFRSSSK